jgi:Mannosyltransferase (PIG-V)
VTLQTQSNRFPFIVSTFLITRVVIFSLALFAVLRMPINAVEARGFHLPPQSHSYLEAWARYDACWYVVIAEHGYRDPISSDGDIRPAFFPLYPALVAAASWVARPPLLAGLIVSNLCYFLFLVVLWKIVRLDWDTSIAQRVIWIYLLFPSAFFLSGAYSESALLLVAAAAVLAARHQRWLWAGVLAGLATLARPVGVVAVVPVIAEYIAMRRVETRPMAVDLATLVAPTVVAGVGFLLFSTWMFGDPLASLTGQVSIRGPVSAPWQPFINMWQSGPRLHAFDNSIVDASLAIVALATIPLVYLRVRHGYAWYALLIVLIPLSGSLISFNRLLLPSFPHAILLARSVKRPGVWIALVISLAGAEAAMMVAFATWNWVA